MISSDRQTAVADWLIRAFGVEVATSPFDRAARVVEEATELAQAQGLTKERVLAMVEYVYGRPPGDPRQELGGARLTLLGYAAAIGASADHEEIREVERVLSTDIEKFRKRQAEKVAAGVVVLGAEVPPTSSGAIDWTKYTSSEIFGALLTAPVTAGAWSGTEHGSSRSDSTGLELAYVYRDPDAPNLWQWEIAYGCHNDESEYEFSAAEQAQIACDKALHQEGWTLVGGAA